MTFLKLLCANLRFKPLTAFFNVLLLAFGISTILTLSHLEQQMSERFSRDLKGIDLVVSGKGSPLQVILSAVFHLDIPTGNIDAADADKLSRNPLIKSAIPLALGDNYNGFRIVGTTPAYLSHYHAEFAAGKIFSKEMDFVIGADVAASAQLNLGDKIVGAHGLVNSDDLHTDFPYVVTGILAPTGSVIDRLVLTPVQSVWHVHEHPDEDDAEEVAHKADHPGAEYTALLISYASPMAAVSLPRQINAQSNMQAASPAFEMARLMKLFGTGSDLLSAFGVLLTLFAVFGFFVTLSNAIHERLYDLALMRSMGATRSRIFMLIFLEALFLGGAGILLGLIMTQIFLQSAGIYIESTKHIHLTASGFSFSDLKICLLALALSLAAGILPAIRAYRLNIIDVLKRS